MCHARKIARLAPLALLAGCGFAIPLGKPDFGQPEVVAQAEALSAPFTTRQQVHATLGTPAIRAPDGSAEVFHVTDPQRQLMGIGFPPLIVPLPMWNIHHTARTLITYDEEGTVTGVDAAYRRTETGRLDGAVLRAGDYEFVHAQADLLLVKRERYVAMHATGGELGCTVLVGCGRPCSAATPGKPASDCGVCWTRLRVGDGAIQELPLLQVINWRLEDDTEPDAAGGISAAESRCDALGGRVLSTGSDPLCILSRYALLPLRLEPGRHHFIGVSKSLDGEARGEIECAAGDVFYAALDGEVTQHYSFTQQLRTGLRVGAATGRITFSPDPPPGLEEQRVILNW